ncbi:sensor histidine kinase [Propionicicella superfundia]|uniref:sensor histidine kinase n=1 Tax=Propionicicella superfundia TaxID=348582 RepID=UPI000405A9EC|nr:ATP-binding protein [Propionicicella superfundia]
MDPIAASVLALFAGLAIGAGGSWLARRRAAEQTDVPVAPSIADLVPLLESAVLWVGEHDEILSASPRAVSLGVAQGTRVGSAPLLEAVREARRTGIATEVQVSLSRGLGVSVDLLAHVSPAADQSVFVVAVDKAQEERVMVAVHDFVANTSHELKTPVGAIALLAEALSQEPTDAAMVERFSGRILTETTRLTELVSQLIALSRLQSADPMLSATDVRVGDLVGAVLARFGTLAGQCGVQIARAGDLDLVIHGDREQLETALANLVHNAIAYSSDHARVTVSVRTAVRDGTDVVELAVTDNGIGIADDEQERVFERFYRVDYARSRDSGGTGLGLPIVRHIAQAHGGDVTLWSQVGRGSTFTIRIPTHGKGGA